jgi:AcrR family transcriptional regulator
MKRSEEQGDLRVRRTHKLLWEALLAELAARPFEDVTVTDICERAMVHRTTFYKHYEDKYTLLERGMRQMFDAMVAEGHRHPPGASSADGPPPYFVRLFEHAAEHQHFYRLMLCGDGINQFHRWVKDYLAEVAATRMGASLPTGDRRGPFVAMRAQFLAGGVLSLLAWWLSEDMPFTPHQMAQFLASQQGTAISHP